MNLISLPPDIQKFATMEDLTNTYLENRYYLTQDERKLFELIKNMNDVSLQLMEKQIPYLNATLLYGESGVGKTAFSRYVAYKLGLPYLYVNFSRMPMKRQYGRDGASSEISRSTTCLLQLLDAVTNDHIIIAATNLIEDVDAAVKRRFTEKHELHRLSSEDNEHFICQYLDDTGYAYDLDSVKAYAQENHSQAEIMTHVTRSIASMLINRDELVML